jgi:hypothetical protein
MSIADKIEALFEETLRDLDREAEFELREIGREFLQWLEKNVPLMPCDNWRYEFDRFIAKLAREHVIVAKESCREWIQWLQEVNDAARLDGRQPGSPCPVQFYTWEGKYDPPIVTSNKPAPFDPDYPQLRGTGNAIMEHNPPDEWVELAQSALQSYRVPQEIKDAFVGWLDDEPRKVLGFGLSPNSPVMDEAMPAATRGDFTGGPISDTRAKRKLDAESNQLAMADGETPGKPAQPGDRAPSDKSGRVTFRSIRNGKQDVVVESVVESLVVPKGIALGNVAPDLHGLLVKLNVVVGGDGIPQLSIVDLYLPVKIEIARTAGRINVPDDVLAKTRVHEQRHADAFAPPIALAEREIGLVNAQLKLIDPRRLTKDQIKKLADAVRQAAEELTKGYLLRRLGLEIVRQSYHLGHYDEKRITIEDGKFVEDTENTHGSGIPSGKAFREAVRPFLRYQLTDDAIDKLKNIHDVRNALDKERVYLDEKYKAEISELIGKIKKVSAGAR